MFDSRGLFGSSGNNSDEGNDIQEVPQGADRQVLLNSQASICLVFSKLTSDIIRLRNLIGTKQTDEANGQAEDQIKDLEQQRVELFSTFRKVCDVLDDQDSLNRFTEENEAFISTLDLQGSGLNY